MSPKYFRKIYHPQPTVRQTERLSDRTRSRVDPAFRRVYHPELGIFLYLFNYSKPVYQHPRNASKNFRKISDPELEISLYLSNFSKEVSQ